MKTTPSPARKRRLRRGRMAGVLALALATIGLYGLVSFSVSRRTREVGIRMSLGSGAVEVMTLILAGAMKLVAAGGIVGLVAAFALAQLLRHILYGVGPWDPVTLAGVPLLLGSAAALAALIPARRASRVDPLAVLAIGDIYRKMGQSDTNNYSA